LNIVLWLHAVPLAFDGVLRPAEATQTPVIALGYADDGYYLEPCSEGVASQVRIEGEAITLRVPVAAGARLSVNGVPFGLAVW